MQICYMSGCARITTHIDRNISAKNQDDCKRRGSVKSRRKNELEREENEQSKYDDQVTILRNFFKENDVYFSAPTGFGWLNMA